MKSYEGGGRSRKDQLSVQLGLSVIGLVACALFFSFMNGEKKECIPMAEFLRIRAAATLAVSELPTSALKNLNNVCELPPGPESTMQAVGLGILAKTATAEAAADRLTSTAAP